MSLHSPMRDSCSVSDCESPACRPPLEVEVSLSPIAQPRATASPSPPPPPPPVEERLLRYGQYYAERAHEQRRQRLEALHRQEQAAMAAAAIKRKAPATANLYHEGSAPAGGPSPPSVLERREGGEAFETRRSSARASSAQEESQPQHRPTLCAASRAMAQRRREKTHAAHLSTEDALLAWKVQTNAALAQKRQEESRASLHRHQRPAISDYAKGVDLPLTAAQRLYQLARQQQAEAAEVEEAANRLSAQQQRQRTPTVTAKAAALKRETHQSAHEALYASAVEKQKRSRAAAAAASTPGHAFQPTVNPTSAIIAARMGTTSAQRLMTATVLRLPVDKESTAQHTDPSATTGSSNIRGHDNKAHSSSRTTTTLRLEERSHRWAARRDEKLAEQRRMDSQEAMAACTFQPAITALPASYHIHNRVGHIHTQQGHTAQHSLVEDELVINDLEKYLEELADMGLLQSALEETTRNRVSADSIGYEHEHDDGTRLVMDKAEEALEEAIELTKLLTI